MDNRSVSVILKGRKRNNSSSVPSLLMQLPRAVRISLVSWMCGSRRRATRITKNFSLMRNFMTNSVGW